MKLSNYLLYVPFINYTFIDPSLQLSELPYPSFMSKKLSDVNVGSMTNVCVVNQNCPVHKALQYFIEYGVSALPVVDQDGQLIDIYAKFDVIVSLKKNLYFI